MNCDVVTGDAIASTDLSQKEVIITQHTLSLGNLQSERIWIIHRDSSITFDRISFTRCLKNVLRGLKTFVGLGDTFSDGGKTWLADTSKGIFG